MNSNRQPKTAAIVGGGVIGGGWAARFLLHGWDVVVSDPDPDAQRKIDAVMSAARRSLPALYDRELPAEGKLRFAGSLAEAVADARWIQESVPERLDIKHAVYREIEELVTPDVIISSSTSGFRPSELQRNARYPARIIVSHPFNPVYLLPLAEVVAGDEPDPEVVETARTVLQQIGMKPLVLRREIDAHVADRFLEAVWREGLWLIKDDIATTTEIDDAIRYGFGLRWAQMGLFETYRLAGGEAGMAHFIAQFGPCLSWPWTKLMDVPELTDDLVQKISDQSDAQSGHHSIRELERIRDDNLVGIMRALKSNNWGAGQVLRALEQSMKASAPAEPGGMEHPPITWRGNVLPAWLDAYGHMNDASYLRVFSDASDNLLELLEVGLDYVSHGKGYVTAETHLCYQKEVRVGEALQIESRILYADARKLHVFHRMLDAAEEQCATAEQLFIHVDLARSKSCALDEPTLAAISAMADRHANLPTPPETGRSINPVSGK